MLLSAQGVTLECVHYVDANRMQLLSGCSSLPAARTRRCWDGATSLWPSTSCTPRTATATCHLRPQQTLQCRYTIPRCHTAAHSISAPLHQLLGVRTTDVIPTAPRPLLTEPLVTSAMQERAFSLSPSRLSVVSTDQVPAPGGDSSAAPKTRSSPDPSMSTTCLDIEACRLRCPVIRCHFHA